MITDHNWVLFTKDNQITIDTVLPLGLAIMITPGVNRYLAMIDGPAIISRYMYLFTPGWRVANVD